jgi:predicted RNase H-like HicB family nuclease
VTDPIVRRYAIVIEGDDTTNYSAYAPDLPGCVATGATVEEAEQAMRLAIDFHLEGLRAEGERVPEPTAVSVALA